MNPWREEVRRTLRLAAPLVLGQLTSVLMTFVDTVMSGRLSAEALASVAAGAAVWHTVMLFGLGVLLAVPPSVAALDGAGRRSEIGPVVRQALWIAAGLTLLTVAVVALARPLLDVMEIETALHDTILGYLRALLWGAPAMYAFLALRFLAEGMGISRPVMYFGFLGLGVNVVANWSLIYGKLGMPALGAVGCGYATSIVWWVILVGIIVYLRRHPLLSTLDLFAAFERPNRQALSELLALGLPIGFTLFVEVSMFAGVALLMGSISTVAVAGHQVAINVASLTFMLPLGISLATTVRVGNALGRRDAEGVARAGWVGMQLAVGVQVISAIVLFTMPGLIARVYTRDADVLAMAAQLLLLAAIFQLPDGLQAAGHGALRGLQDTRGPLAITLVAYWLVGMPVGAWLAFGRDLGPPGLWYGIIGGLAIAGALLVWRFRIQIRRSRTAAGGVSSAPAA